MRFFAPQRRHLTALVALVTVTLAVVAAVSVTWMTASDSSTPSPGVEAQTSEAPPNVTPGPEALSGVNPWAFNDPATIMRFLADRCPEAPPIATVDELIPALQACLTSTP